MIRAAIALLLAALLAGCATPVGVEPVSSQETHRAAMVNAMSAGVASEWSAQVLRREGLFERHARDPVETLDALYALFRQHQTTDRLFALAELSYLHAQRFDIRAYYLAATVFAYAYLLPDDEKAAIPALDPRARLAVDIYNHGLAEGLVSRSSGQLELEPATHILPFGNLRVTIDPAQFLWAGHRLKSFVPTARMKVHGLRNRYRQPGVGAPLAAEIEPQGTGPALEALRKRIPPRTRVPVTVFLRIDEPLAGVLAGDLQARVELYTADQVGPLRIGGRDVPLEFEYTASIAAQLDGAKLWDRELAGFRFAEAPILGDGLIMLQPHRPGRIPVVLVHGTASSPARWAEMYNELANDPQLKQRYQFWLFQYNTGQPVLYSALMLRRGLRAALAEVDPGRNDAALRRVVVIGHSQGGLLARLMAIDSGMHFWNNVSQRSLEEMDMPAETKDLLREGMFFAPVPEVERVVFIATPHRGSFRAGSGVQAIVRRLLTMPGRLVQGAQALTSRPEFAQSGMDQLPTSIDNMNPDNKFIQTLASIPVEERVKVNSIVAVRGAGGPHELDDGVVAYPSAHMDPAESELVVRSRQSAQATPQTIEEVRRILHEHLRAAPR